MDDDSEPVDEPSLLPAAIFELLFGLAGLALAWGIGLWVPARLEHLGTPYHAVDPRSLAIGILQGLLWTIPLLLIVPLIRFIPLESLPEMQRWVDRHLAPQFHGRTLPELALLAFAAGLGEELFFRWAIQGGFVRLFDGPQGILLGLTFGALAFGMMHSISSAYGILASLIGLFLGIELLVTGSLWAVVTTHAAYDLVVLYTWSLRPLSEEH